jgi:hypothetical protein
MLKILTLLGGTDLSFEEFEKIGQGWFIALEGCKDVNSEQDREERIPVILAPLPLGKVGKP